MISYFELLRPKQWLKNIFVVAPVIFSFSFLDPQKVILALAAFFVFCAASSAVYILNDIKDAESDRAHPLKRNRPIARRDAGVFASAILGLLLATFSLWIGYLISAGFFAAVMSYLILNTAYSLRLKYIFLLDMFAVALGFVLRIIAGVAAIGVSLAPWSLSAVFFLALFIVAIKRLQETKFSPVGNLYTAEFLRSVIFVSLILTVAIFVFYIFLDIKSLALLAAVLPVLYGMFRFMWLADSGATSSGNPTDMIFEDRPMQYAIAIFVLLVVSIFSTHFTSYASIFFAF